MIKIDGTAIGPGERTYLIAEIGISARDDIELAKRTISVAADNGADAVKFQTHLADHEMHEAEMRRIGAGEVYDTVQRCEWTLDELRELQDQADDEGVTFLSTPFSVEAVEVLGELNVPAIKIGSGELTNYHLLSNAASTGRPMLVSTGMHSVDEIAAANEFLTENTDEYAFLYCVSSYPTSPDDFDFGALSQLREISNAPVGFSDHSTGVEASKVAIGHGATFIEKHFTIDRRLPGPDQQVAIEPHDLADLESYVQLVHETDSSKESLLPEEVDITSWARHSIVSRDDIAAGERITEAAITTKRPSTGISASQYYEVVGMTAGTDIPKNTVLQDEHLED